MMDMDPKAPSLAERSASRPAFPLPQKGETEAQLVLLLVCPALPRSLLHSGEQPVRFCSLGLLGPWAQSRCHLSREDPCCLGRGVGRAGFPTLQVWLLLSTVLRGPRAKRASPVGRTSPSCLECPGTRPSVLHTEHLNCQNVPKSTSLHLCHIKFVNWN